METVVELLLLGSGKRAGVRHQTQEKKPMRSKIESYGGRPELGPTMDRRNPQEQVRPL